VEREWPDMNAYAEAKTEVITEIKQRARRAAGHHDAPGPTRL
jgi:hypothetical protein